MRDNRTQMGEGRAGSIIALLVFAAVAYAGWNAGPVYIAHYQLKDEMADVVRTPRYRANDDKLYEMLDTYVRQERLSDFIGRENFKIDTRVNSRTISVSYERTVKYLPGYEVVKVFEGSVESPLL